MDEKVLQDAGIDFEGAVKRFLGEPSFYERLLTQFLDDLCVTKARRAYAEGDLHQFFWHVHEMKGVSGNLHMTKLFKASCDIVDAIRRDRTSQEVIEPLYQAFIKEYMNVIVAIEKASK